MSVTQTLSDRRWKVRKNLMIALKEAESATALLQEMNSPFVQNSAWQAITDAQEFLEKAAMLNIPGSTPIPQLEIPDKTKITASELGRLVSLANDKVVEAISALDLDIHESESDAWWLLDKVFTTRFVKSAASGRGLEPLERASLAFLGSEVASESNYKKIEKLWKILCIHHRVDHFYVEALVVDCLNGKLKTNSAIPEFTVSLADGSEATFDLATFDKNEAIAYLIQSQYESFEKLSSWLPKYATVFPMRYVVCSTDAVKDVKDVVGQIDSCAGVKSVNPEGEVAIAKEAVFDSSQLEVLPIYNSLRDSEIEEILLDRFGKLPEVQNGDKKGTYLEKIKEIPLEEFQKFAMDKLRQRGFAGNLGFEIAPKGLKSCAYFAKLGQIEWELFDRFLNGPRKIEVVFK